MAVPRQRSKDTEADGTTPDAPPPDFIGVHVLKNYPTTATASTARSSPSPLAFPVGSALSIPIRDDGVATRSTTTLVVTSGARLLLSTACVEQSLEASGQEATLCLSTGENGGGFLSLCRFQEGTAPTVTSLGVNVSGPRTVKLAAKIRNFSNENSVNVFGSVVLDDQLRAAGGVPVGGGVRAGSPTVSPPADAKDARAGRDETPKSRPRKRKKAGENGIEGSKDSDEDDRNAQREGEPDTVENAAGGSEALEAQSLEQATPLSKKQRKKLAKKKAKELEEAVAKEQGYDTTKKGEKSKTTKANASATPDNMSKKAASLTRERRLDGGIVVRDIIVGAGPPVRPGRKVSINYEGAFPDGRVFDKNKSKSNPLCFRPGTGEVIKGLERGLDGMKVGGERVITVPPELGYGRKGSGNVIPGNATLLFTVQLVGVGGGR